MIVPRQPRLVVVKVGTLRAVRIKYSIKERPKGCSYCKSRSHRTYFAYGRLAHVYCNRNCMINHQLEQLMEPKANTK